MSQTNIIRRPDFAGGGLTDDERRQMAEHVKLWTARAFRTSPIEPDKIAPAIKALYAAADLPEPHVIIVPSPRVMALAGGAAAWWWYCRERAATMAATETATERATADATADATWAATWAATERATRDATDAATRDATADATWGVTADATDVATRGATRGATADATRDATERATRAATRAATERATRGATDVATRGATNAATDVATRGATETATEAATADATRGATNAATADATERATRAATWAATNAATADATERATWAATWAATERATRAATEDATERATWAAPADATWAATGLGAGAIKCAQQWWRCYHGGNMWPAWVAYLTAARDILGLRLPAHEKFAAWEQCAIHGGFRWMHEKFCMVSDFPEILAIDDRNRPHSETGPSHRWRDGWSLYHWHGTRVESWVIEHPERITPALIDAEQNAEVRRVMLERYGNGNYIRDSQREMVSEDAFGRLWRATDATLAVEVVNSTPEPDGSRHIYWLGVHPECRPLLDEGALGDPQPLTPRNAVASTFGLTGAQYAPQQET